MISIGTTKITPKNRSELVFFGCMDRKRLVLGGPVRSPQYLGWSWTGCGPRLRILGAKKRTEPDLKTLYTMVSPLSPFVPTDPLTINECQQHGHATSQTRCEDENNKQCLSSFIVFYFQLSNPPSLSTKPAHRHHLSTFQNSRRHPKSSPLTPQRPRHVPQERHTTPRHPVNKPRPGATSPSCQRRGNQMVNKKDGEGQKRQTTT
jgi:hypothetical protein